MNLIKLMICVLIVVHSVTYSMEPRHIKDVVSSGKTDLNDGMVYYLYKVVSSIESVNIDNESRARQVCDVASLFLIGDKPDYFVCTLLFFRRGYVERLKYEGKDLCKQVDAGDFLYRYAIKNQKARVADFLFSKSEICPLYSVWNEVNKKKRHLKTLSLDSALVLKKE